MKLSEICEAVRDGSIEVDMAGHAVNINKERFLQAYDELTASAAGSNDGKWDTRDGKTQEEVSRDMREFYQCHLDREYKEGQQIYAIGTLDAPRRKPLRGGDLELIE